MLAIINDMLEFNIFDALPMQINNLCAFAFDCIVKYGSSREFWLQLFILVTGLVGQILVARKDIRAFYFWCVGNVLIILSTLPKEQYGMALFYFLSIGFNLYSIHKWKKDLADVGTKAEIKIREVKQHDGREVVSLSTPDRTAV